MDEEPVYAEALRQLRHDINNQLSNIHLALDSIRHETLSPTEEFNICADAIYNSALKINALLKDFG